MTKTYWGGAGVYNQAKARYKEKIKMIDSFDPFLLPDSGSCVTSADPPPVEASDLVSYLVLSNN